MPELSRSLSARNANLSFIDTRFRLSEGPITSFVSWYYYKRILHTAIIPPEPALRTSACAANEQGSSDRKRVLTLCPPQSKPGVAGLARYYYHKGKPRLINTGSRVLEAVRYYFPSYLYFLHEYLLVSLQDLLTAYLR